MSQSPLSPLGISPELADYNNELKAEALRRAAYVLGGGLAIGALSSALLTPWRMTRSPKLTSDAPVALIYPQQKKKKKNPGEENEEVLPPRLKAAQDDIFRRVVDATVPLKPGGASPLPFSPSWWVHGSPANTNSSLLPWAVPLYAGAATAGLLGGHALVSRLAKSSRKYKLRQDVAEAKKDYEQAILESYDKAAIRELPKEAAFVEAMAKCAALLEKAAVPGWVIPTALVAGTGMAVGNGLDRVAPPVMASIGSGYLTLAALLAGAAGMGTYSYLKKRRNSRLLEKAVKKRDAQNAMLAPSPVSVSVRPVTVADDEE